MPHASTFSLGSVHIGDPQLFLIAGPCVLESETHARSLADAIQRITSDLGIPYIFKASFDKANRTSIHSFRGPGLTEGTRILRAIAESNHLPVLTDIHTPDQCAQVSDALGPADILLQIPAFLCRQTDLLIAAAETGRAINVKKGQFVAPSDMRHAVQKISEARSQEVSEARKQKISEARKPDATIPVNPRVCLTERGTSFGYNNLVVDMRSLPTLRAFAPVIFDATHSVQTPSAASASGKDGIAVSGGNPEFIPTLARAAVAAGIDGIFLEVHDNPSQARSDGANALRLDLLKPLLETLLSIHHIVRQ